MTIRKLSVSLAAMSALALSAPAFAKVTTGEMAPDFTATDSNGVTHNLSDFKGKTVVLEWTNHECPYVKKHYNTDNMQDTQRVADDQDIVWISVVSSAPGKQGYVTGEQANAQTALRNAVPDAVILDPAGDVGRLYAAQTTPHMYIVNPEGELIYQGAIDDNRSSSPATVRGAKNYVKMAMTELGAGEALTHAETRPYGCSVKY